MRLHAAKPLGQRVVIANLAHGELTYQALEDRTALRKIIARSSEEVNECVNPQIAIVTIAKLQTEDSIVTWKQVIWQNSLEDGDDVSEVKSLGFHGARTVHLPYSPQIHFSKTDPPCSHQVISSRTK